MKRYYLHILFQLLCSMFDVVPYLCRCTHTDTCFYQYVYVNWVRTIDCRLVSRKLPCFTLLISEQFNIYLSTYLTTCFPPPTFHLKCRGGDINRGLFSTHLVFFYITSLVSYLAIFLLEMFMYHFQEQLR